MSEHSPQPPTGLGHWLPIRAVPCGLSGVVHTFAAQVSPRLSTSYSRGVYKVDHEPRELVRAEIASWRLDVLDQGCHLVIYLASLSHLFGDLVDRVNHCCVVAVSELASNSWI